MAKGRSRGRGIVWLALFLLLALILWLLLRRESPGQELDSASPWDGDYERVPADLCPPGGEAIGQPVFGDIRQEPRSGMEVWVRAGELINAHGEVFIVEVVGTNKEAVRAYTDDLRVCFDLILTGEATAAVPESVEPAGIVRLDTLRSGPDNLSIGISPVEVCQWPATDVETQVTRVPQTGAPVPECNHIPIQEWLTELSQDYVVDFILDPAINAGVSHDYPVQCKKSANVMISVASGAGKVEGALYYNGTVVATRRVQKGGTTTGSMSHSSSPAYSNYDLAVSGLQDNSRYSVSGRWSRSSGAAAPGGGGAPCAP